MKHRIRSARLAGCWNVGVLLLLATLCGLLPQASGQNRSAVGFAVPTTDEAQRIVQDLYARQDAAWTDHDIRGLFSFFHSSYVFIDAKGKRMSFPEWERSTLQTLETIRDSQMKTTVKHVEVRGDSLVASIESTDSYQVRDAKRGSWVPFISSSDQEETWSRFGAAWKLVATRTLRQSSFEPVPLNTMIEHDSQLISFLSGSPLSAEERQRIAAFAANQVRRNANDWYKNDASIGKDLKSIRENPGAISAEMWEKWRFSYETSAREDVEAQIVEAHDRTIAFDRELGLGVTEQTVRTLETAMSWVAHQSGAPSPDADFGSRLRQAIREQYLKWPKDVRASYAHIIKDFPATLEYMFGVMPEAKRKEFLSAWGRELQATTEGATHLAANMASFYNLLVQAKMREYIQVTGWGLQRLRNANLCRAIQPGVMVTTPFCPLPQ